MVSIAELVAELSTKPMPVLCLDTCDFLNVIRGISLEDLSSTRSFVRILSALDTNEDRLRLVVTYLVEHEWTQNFEGVGNHALRDILRISDQLEVVLAALNYVDLPPLNRPDLKGLEIVDGLLGITTRVIDRASILQQDRLCVDRAFERLMAKTRPSHKYQIKDSIHLEHYLELAGQLRSSGFAERCLFVSANKSDFWAESGPSRVHPDLEQDLQSAGLTFMPRLESAIRELGI